MQLVAMDSDHRLAGTVSASGASGEEDVSSYVSVDGPSIA